MQAGSSKFAWKRHPSSALEFEQLMLAIDDFLAKDGLTPSQRPLHVARCLWDAFRWEGNVFPPKSLAHESGFDGAVLMAKAHAWYERVYADRLNDDWAYGHAPVALGKALWKVRAGVAFGSVTMFLDRDLTKKGVVIGTKENKASLNMLTQVEKLPQGLVDVLTDAQLIDFANFFYLMYHSLRFASELPKSHLFGMSQADYADSTDALLSRRFNQSKWATQQAVEKIIKGFLHLANKPFPTGGKHGHDLVHLGGLLRDDLKINIEEALLRKTSCSPSIRYNSTQVSEEDAITSNHGYLQVLGHLRECSEATAFLTGVRTKVAAP